MYDEIERGRGRRRKAAVAYPLLFHEKAPGTRFISRRDLQ